MKPTVIDVAAASRALAMNTRRIRVASRLTLEAASERGGLSLRHWQKVEAGQANATVETLVRLAAALDVSIGALFRPCGRGALPARPRGRPARRRQRSDRQT